MERRKLDLDERLLSADGALCPRRAPTSTVGEEIRTSAANRTRRRNWLAIGGLIVCVGTAMWVWDRDLSVGAPDVAATQQPRFQAHEMEERRVFDRQDLRWQQTRRILALELRLERLQYRLASHQHWPNSAESVERENAAAWSVLVQLAPWDERHREQRKITYAEREQLERLIRAFPQTTAESVARNMLAKNEVSHELFRE